jgi:transcriptional regulator with XRE-family HTH domain
MTPEEEALSARIGLRLREARNTRRLSLQTLSNRTGGILSKSRISNYEQGVRRMGIEEARLLSKALGTVTAGYLLCLDDEGFLDAEEQQLLDQFRRADARGRATILALARSQCEAAEK